MRKEIITNGSVINTLEGNITITGSNGCGIIYGDEYIINDAEELELSNSNMTYTVQDLARFAKELDGRSHDYRYADFYITFDGDECRPYRHDYNTDHFTLQELREIADEWTKQDKADNECDDHHVYTVEEA